MTETNNSISALADSISRMKESILVLRESSFTDSDIRSVEAAMKIYFDRLEGLLKALDIQRLH
jgi:hypothetical protein